MKTVVIFGGSGFIGQNIVRRLSEKGYRIIIPYQIPIRESKLKLYGKLGQIIPIKFNSLKDIKIEKIIESADVIVNLKTIWRERKNNTYKNLILDFNVDLLDLMNASKKDKHFIFFSGLGVDEFSKSKRIQNIFETEKYFYKNMKNLSIIRPSVVIGQECDFLIKLVQIIKLLFLVPIFGKGNAQFQPIFVDDVACAVRNIIENKYFDKRVYELAGPTTFDFRSFYLLIIKILDVKRILLNIPFKLAFAFVFLFEKLSINLITKEQLLLFKSDSVSLKSKKDLQYLDIKPRNVEEVIKNIINNN